MTKTSLHGLLSAIEKHYLWTETPIFEDAASAVSELASMKSQMEALRAAARKLAADYTRLSAPLRETLDEGFRLDSIYDRKLAGLCQTLRALSMTTDNHYLGEALQTMRQTLFPDGVLGETESYLRHSGYVVVADMRITLDMRDTLKGIVYNGCSLLDDYTEWVMLGKRLSQVESKWKRLIEEDLTDAMSPIDLRNMRIRWRVLLDGMRAVIAESDALDGAVREALLEGLGEVETIYRVDENVYQLGQENRRSVRTG